LEPLPTGEVPVAKRLPGIRAVLFDVYGTLLVSGSGEVGTALAETPAFALRDALGEALVEGDLHQAALTGAEILSAEISAEHDRLRLVQVDHPEVDIREIWSAVLAKLHGLGLVSGPVSVEGIERLAVEYELRVNPVWPMPGGDACLAALRQRGMLLGIVSNAQFYTPLTLEALWGRSPIESGFAPDLCVWSFQLRRAKPSRVLFDAALGVLRSAYGLTPGECLYVGNDMLNDVAAAQPSGCRTALFAGDRRSLRRRADDPRCRGVEPDAVVTTLAEIPAIAAGA